MEECKGDNKCRSLLKKAMLKISVKCRDFSEGVGGEFLLHGG